MSPMGYAGLAFLLVFLSFVLSYWLLQVRPERQAEAHLDRRMEPVKRAETKSSPAPPVKTSTPSATPVSVPARPSVAKDILKDLELPPDAPKFGELTPAKSIAQPRAQAPV